MLAIIVICVVGVATWLILTNTQTPAERDETLRDEEMWP